MQDRQCERETDNANGSNSPRSFLARRSSISHVDVFPRGQLSMVIPNANAAKVRIRVCFQAYRRPRHYFLSSSFFASSSSLRLAASTLGYDSLSSSNVSTRTADTTSRVNHLLSAGTTYQGALSVAVLRIMSS